MSVIERDEQRRRRRIACTCGLSRAPIDQGKHAEDCPLGIYDALTHQHAGAVDALKHILESAEHPSLTVRSTEYIAKVAGDALAALPLPSSDVPNGGTDG